MYYFMLLWYGPLTTPEPLAQLCVAPKVNGLLWALPMRTLDDP
jgi:hypothetical protein